ncbi:MAG: hypothetical protein GY800_08970 [Planctomycetes bacterium]|nr:hypothetical protein [Planctomycetota bacterium]
MKTWTDEKTGKMYEYELNTMKTCSACEIEKECGEARKNGGSMLCKKWWNDFGEGHFKETKPKTYEHTDGKEYEVRAVETTGHNPACAMCDFAGSCKIRCSEKMGRLGHENRAGLYFKEIKPKTYDHSDGKEYEFIFDAVARDLCSKCDLKRDCDTQSSNGLVILCERTGFFTANEEGYFKLIPPEPKFKPGHIGQKVWHVRAGKGEIYNYGESKSPVCVRFENGTEWSYTDSGRAEAEDQEPVLYFWNEDLKFTVENEVIPEVKKKMWLVVGYKKEGDCIKDTATGFRGEQKEANEYSLGLVREGYKIVKFEEVEI